MSVTLAADTKDVVSDSVVDLLDVGSTNATGRMLFKKTDGTLLATLNMSNPAFGDSAAGVATAGAIAQGVVVAAIVAQTIGRCEFNDRDAAEVFRCAVATSGSDINLTSVVVNTGDTIDVTALTVTTP